MSNIIQKLEEFVDEVEADIGLKPSFPSALPPADQRLKAAEGDGIVKTEVLPDPVTGVTTISGDAVVTGTVTMAATGVNGDGI